VLSIQDGIEKKGEKELSHDKSTVYSELSQPKAHAAYTPTRQGRGNEVHYI
jgi:hypothetical protein